MRWLLLGVPVVLLAGVLFYVFRPEAEPEPDPTEKKVSGRPAPGEVSDAELARKDPVAFLEKCLRYYDRTVHGYRTVLHKQERIDGRLQDPEEILACFREKPFSVYMEWLQGARKAERALYVEGENDDQMLARPRGFLARKIAGDVVERDPDGREARASGRYTLPGFGLKKALERILASWKKARKRDALHVEYLGVYKVRELDDRACYKFHRTYDPPEEDGIADMLLYIDKDNLLPVGTVLKDSGGRLIGEYFFRDLRLNPKFKPGQFSRQALIP